MEKKCTPTIVPFLIMLSMMLSITGCANPYIGKMAKPAHSLNDWGFRRVERDFFVLNIEYTVKDNQITFDGNVVCKNSTGNIGRDSAATGWGTADSARLSIDFFFLDSSDMVIGQETERLRENGEICKPRHFNTTFPYKDTYKSIEYRMSGKLYAW
jgi:hypothetical protein